jgi:hypothetical protein
MGVYEVNLEPSKLQKNQKIQLWVKDSPNPISAIFVEHMVGYIGVWLDENHRFSWISEKKIEKIVA